MISYSRSTMGWNNFTILEPWHLCCSLNMQKVTRFVWKMCLLPSRYFTSVNIWVTCHRVSFRLWQFCRCFRLNKRVCFILNFHAFKWVEGLCVPPWVYVRFQPPQAQKSFSYLYDEAKLSFSFNKDVYLRCWKSFLAQAFFMWWQWYILFLITWRSNPGQCARMI